MSALTDTDRGVKLSAREFKKLRRQLQRKRYLKIELCDRLSILSLLNVGLIQNQPLLKTIYLKPPITNIIEKR